MKFAPQIQAVDPNHKLRIGGTVVPSTKLCSQNNFFCCKADWLGKCDLFSLKLSMNPTDGTNPDWKAGCLWT